MAAERTERASRPALALPIATPPMDDLRDAGPTCLPDAIRVPFGFSPRARAAAATHGGVTVSANIVNHDLRVSQ